MNIHKCIFIILNSQRFLDVGLINKQLTMFMLIECQCFFDQLHLKLHLKSKCWRQQYTKLKIHHDILRNKNRCKNLNQNGLRVLAEWGWDRWQKNYNHWPAWRACLISLINIQTSDIINVRTVNQYCLQLSLW